LLVVKVLLISSTVENIWMKWFSLKKDPHLVFSSCKILTKDVLPSMNRCYCEEFFLLYVNFVFLVIVAFNLWMNQDVHNTFALVINFLTLDW
jgi:hypothetical protein